MEAPDTNARAGRAGRRRGLALGLLVGFVLTEGLGGPGRGTGGRDPGWAPGEPPHPPFARAACLEELGLRELRSIPGVGPARARAIRQALWTRGPDRPLEEIHGIGVRTARAIEDWLAERGLADSFPGRTKPGTDPDPSPHPPRRN